MGTFLRSDQTGWKTGGSRSLPSIGRRSRSSVIQSSVLGKVPRGPGLAVFHAAGRMVVLFLGQAFGQSFLQPDIHLFKQNLFYLETLNTKQKLYHKVSAHFSDWFLINGAGPWLGPGEAP